jgi:4-hydroxybenzoate polyprenyltransferase
VTIAALIVHLMLAPWPNVLLVFVSCCLAASAGYQLNDVLDFDADRVHKQKRARPLAAGMLSAQTVLQFALALAVSALALAAAVHLAVAMYVLGYMGLSALYSSLLKRIAIIDVLALAALFCARIFAGAAAIAVVVSPYLLAFSLFFFLSLALMKRFIALASGKGDAIGIYRNADLTLFRSGVGMALIAAGLLALYINDPMVRTRYTSPDILWGVWIVLLYIVLRGWLWASQGKLEEDLATAASGDPVVWAAGAAMVFLFLLAY